MTRSLSSTSILLSSCLIHVVQSRTFTVTNECRYTIWQVIYTDLNVASDVPSFPTGWEAPPTNSVTFFVPDDWKSGRIWGRRGCDFSTNPGADSCLDGGCNGGLECSTTAGTGVPPATLAEWTLQASSNLDFYDVSLVDGYNLPIAITTNVNCEVAGCAVDLGPNCPSELAGPTNSSGAVVGCKSACLANLDGDSSDSANCCSGSHSTAATCPPNDVDDYSYFKENCPRTYVYAYDESSGTALWTCNSSLNADYQVTFCPYVPCSTYCSFVPESMFSSHANFFLECFFPFPGRHPRHF
ncbi:thaumatin-like protein [Stereum hirsutum FP-91666 SS1]|uniref:thaumatin-like protein n=1 Tax=Stereum hirsutum (strain FP-91666) TaxID=721885 RepID=UPI000440FB13|nr:thaumatin-like protein [Stereum hirsutum FP-91666 SS1]EIM87400.1 thaumatin-like protein [Stereum hirsutum FP-91666 SS1]